MPAEGGFLFARRNGPAERLDPRSKILSAVLLCVAAALPGKPAAKLVELAIVLGLWACARLGLRALLVGLAALSPLFLSTTVYDALIAVPALSPRFSAGPLNAAYSPEGLRRAGAMCAQLSAFALALALLVRTTSPISLAEGIELLLAPLGRKGLPVQEAAMMFTLSLRFLPIVAEEFGTVRRAQLARGGPALRRGLASRIGGLLAMLVPLFVLSAQRAVELAEAMEARCYSGGSARTSYRGYRMSRADWALLSLSLLVLAWAAAAALS